MKHKILITALIAIGFPLSGASQALSVLRADGTRAVANVEGNKLMLRDATGKLWLLASDGAYKTDDGRTLYVKGGIIGAQSRNGGPPRTYVASRFALPLDIDNKAKGGVIAPIDNKAKGGIIGPLDKKGKAGTNPIGYKPNALPMDQNKLLPAVQKPSASAPSMGSPAAIQRRLLMESDKPGNEVKPGPKPGSGTSIVSDSVLKTGSKISGGWREYAADQSWRRVVFRLDGQVATIVFSDGKPGSRLPSVTHFARSGPGPKGSPASYYNEVRTFAGVPPGILDKAKTSSSIPSDVATRIGEIGGGIKVMQQLAELMRIAELGSALGAGRNPAADGGFFPDRPGGSPGEGNWSAPWRGVGRGGPASSDGDVVVSSEESADANGRRSSSVTRHGDNSTTTVRNESNNDGSSSSSSRTNDADGRIVESRSEGTGSNGNSIVTVVSYDANTGELRTSTSTKSSDGSWSVRTSRVMPSESCGRGFDEAWLARSLPWLMDAYYLQWKRESDLVKSGGRIKQPGRGGQSTMIANESPDVGASAVVNCGDSNTNPCARPAGVGADPRGGFGRISQPGRGGEPGAPIDEKAVPRPIPLPKPKT